MQAFCLFACGALVPSFQVFAYAAATAKFALNKSSFVGTETQITHQIKGGTYTGCRNPMALLAKPPFTGRMPVVGNHNTDLIGAWVLEEPTA